jgi:MFS family permease
VANENAARAVPTTVRGQLCLLLSSPTFVYCTLALSSLFFVVTGIQFWSTEYLIKVIKAPYGTVLASFAATSATAPVLGVVFGGWIVDYVGGYQGREGVFRTSLIGTILGVFAVSLAIPASYSTSFSGALTMIWFVLFFGGAIVPGATGLVLSSVPPQVRAFSSAMSMLTFNIFGYASGTILPGVYMQFLQGNHGTGARTGNSTDDASAVSSAEEDAEYAYVLRAGFRLVLCWSVFGLLFMALSTLSVGRCWSKSGMRRWVRRKLKAAGLRKKRRRGGRARRRNIRKSRRPSTLGDGESSGRESEQTPGAMAEEGRDSMPGEDVTRVSIESAAGDNAEAQSDDGGWKPPSFLDGEGGETSGSDDDSDEDSDDEDEGQYEVDRNEAAMWTL